MKNWIVLGSLLLSFSLSAQVNAEPVDESQTEVLFNTFQIALNKAKASVNRDVLFVHGVRCVAFTTGSGSVECELRNGLDNKKVRLVDEDAEAVFEVLAGLRTRALIGFKTPSRPNPHEALLQIEDSAGAEELNVAVLTCQVAPRAGVLCDIQQR
jgi:hypothetical protein